MSGLEYGNTRLRARRSRLLDEGDYAALLGAETLDQLLGILSDTTYAAAVAAALPRHRGIRRLDEVLRRELSTELRTIPRFYRGCDLPALDLLLERWDLHNLRTILRAKARTDVAADLDGLLVPAGRVTDAELSELAEQPGVRPALDLMVAWGIPSREEARRMVAAWPEYEDTGDVAALEREIARAYAAHLAATVERKGDDADPGGLLGSEIDRINLVVALRLRRARVDAEPIARSGAGAPDEAYLPGGRLRRPLLEAVAAASSAAEAAGLLTAAPLVPGWAEALTTWASDEDLAAFEEALMAATTRHAVGLFRRGDPLSAAIPVAYVFAKENEVRNLRWIGRGITQGMPRSEVAEHLVVAA